MSDNQILIAMAICAVYCIVLAYFQGKSSDYNDAP